MLQARSMNAMVIRTPPMIEDFESGWPVRNQSTMATRNMVSRAATEERTGDVREMSTRKAPEKAASSGMISTLPLLYNINNMFV